LPRISETIFEARCPSPGFSFWNIHERPRLLRVANELNSTTSSCLAEAPVGKHCQNVPGLLLKLLSLEETMRRLLISSAIGLGVLFGALAPTFVPTPASAYYYRYRPYYHHRYYHHRYYGYRPYYRHRYYHHRYYGYRPYYHHRRYYY